MLPNGDKRRDAVLAVVKKNNHAVGIHALADQELVVLEVINDLLRKGLGAALELLDLLFGRALLLERLFDLLHVCCAHRSVILSFALFPARTLEVAEIALLVEAGLLQAEAVGDVEDGLRGIVKRLLAFFGRRVGANVDALVSNADLLAVGFVGNAVDLLEPVRVGDDLVAGDDVLLLAVRPAILRPCAKT